MTGHFAGNHGFLSTGQTLRLQRAVLLSFLLVFAVEWASATAPHITSLSVTTAKVNVTFTITGTNFGSPQGSGYVTVNGTQATSYGTWNATTIQVKVPLGALPTGNVVVTVPGSGSSNGAAFTVPPYISPSGLSLTSGPAQMGFDINGSSFGNAKGTSTANIGAVALTIKSWSNTKIVVQVPAAAATGSVVVTVNANASNGENFTVASYSADCPN
jgi:hypothetical protein